MVDSSASQSPAPLLAGVTHLESALSDRFPLCTICGASGDSTPASAAPKSLCPRCIAPSKIVIGEPCDNLNSLIAHSKWSTIVSARWRDREHINTLECRSVLTAVRWAVKLPQVTGGSHRRILILSDSSAAVGSINKGRSSSHRLLRPLRSLAALLLASGITLRLQWIPSLSNPADAASRLRSTPSAHRQ